MTEKYYWIELFHFKSGKEGRMDRMAGPTKHITGFYMERRDIQKLYDIMGYHDWFEKEFPIEESDGNYTDNRKWLEAQLWVDKRLTGEL